MSTDLPALRIEIRGVPHAQPRPRFVGGRVVSTIGPRVKGWRLAVHNAAQEAALAVGEDAIEALNQFALRMDIEFRLPVPAKNPDWAGLAHWHKPDRDNLEKAVMDELQAAKVLLDDCRIAEGTFRKVWCRPKDAGCVVSLSALPGPPIGRHAATRVAGRQEDAAGSDTGGFG